MLTAISVRNIVLIDQLDLALDDGLTVLTGETGAGKSILLDALTLALGGRGDATLVRNGADSGQVVAVLQLPVDHPVRMTLRDNAIVDDEEVILRRVQFADGRTRAFVNDQPVSVGLLQAIGTLAMEIHGQHDGRALVDAATHRNLLDAFGGLEAETRAVRAAHAALAAAEAEVAAQQAVIAEARAREGYARHMAEELGDLAPEAGEEDTLAARRHRLMQLQKAAQEVADADEILNGPMSPGPVLAGLMRRLLRKGAAAVFHPLVEALDGTLAALDRSGEALETLKRDMAFDPDDLDRVEERLFALRAAARKHGVPVDELPAVLARYAADLEMLASGADVLKAREKVAEAARRAYAAAAKALSGGREQAARDLEAAVARQLPDLKLGSARFIVERLVDAARVSAGGYDQVAFHIQTNPGTSPGPIGRIASGGELSRFLLALKVALADRGSAPVLIFDEIDAGVGGAVADAMGRRLSELAQRAQVIAVTHAPQVAARARSHMLIEKQAVEEGVFMRVHVRPLDASARHEEVARMLAGARVTDEARAAARRLIAEVE